MINIKTGDKIIINPKCCGENNHSYPATWIRDMNKYAGKILTVHYLENNGSVYHLRVWVEEDHGNWRYDGKMILGVIDTKNENIIYNDQVMDNKPYDGDYYDVDEYEYLL